VGALTLEEKLALHRAEKVNTLDHCLRGEWFLKRYSFFEGASRIVRHHHTCFQEFTDSIEVPYVFDAQLIHLADFVERHTKRNRYILHQNEEIMKSVKNLPPEVVHPSVKDLFFAAAQREEFWLDLTLPRLYSLLLNYGPLRYAKVGLRDLEVIATLFRDLIDFRSPFTATHSTGVAVTATALAKFFDFSKKEITLMKVAGYLHDIGKLTIPNSILEKKGPLSKKETAIIKSHTYYSYMIINSIKGLSLIAEWASYHHEKLDGSGYPFRCTVENLSLGARIMAVADIFTALSEDRPYRKGMSKETIVTIMEQFAQRGLLDKKIVSTLLTNYEPIYKTVQRKQEEIRTYYEKQRNALLLSP